VLPLKKCVSVVDDDPLVLGAIERLLRARGFEVRTYPSAEAFLDDAPARDSACLVLDIDLGGISGIELGRRLTNEGSRTPVVYITGVSRDRVDEEALATVPAALLHKPFPASQLFAAIAKATAP
jgi:FixJ family two-component response regulator